MNLGSQIVAELGARGLRGMFFDFRGYCELKRVCTVEELRAFLDARGFESVAASPFVATVVKDLRRETGEESCAAWFLLRPFLWLAVAFGVGGK